MCAALLTTLAMFSAEFHHRPVTDYAWHRIQCEWIREAAEITRLEQVLPQEHADWVRLLGADKYGFREIAQRHLLKFPKEQLLPTLMWGLKHADPEVANRCDYLLGRIGMCPKCDGMGVCSFDAPAREVCLICNDLWPEPFHHACRACDGRGEAWSAQTSTYLPPEW